MKLPFNIDLKDKVCVVTGGTGVICGAMADALAECGAKVAILALGKDGCDNKAREINEKGGTAIGIETNVLDKENSLETIKAKIQSLEESVKDYEKINLYSQSELIEKLLNTTNATEEEANIFYEDYSGHIVQDDNLVRLIGMPNVIVTSHQAFLTKEALDNIANTTITNIVSFFKGEPKTETEVCFH